jgi:hypothetical protein
MFETDSSTFGIVIIRLWSSLAGALQSEALRPPMKTFFGILRYFLSSRCTFEWILVWQPGRQGRQADDRHRLTGGRPFLADRLLES